MRDNSLEKKGLIPLDKSWFIRMAILDVINGSPEKSIGFLEQQEDLSDDLIAVLRCVKGNYDAGESATVYRFFRYYLLKSGIDMPIKKQGSLQQREIYGGADVIDKSMEELLELDEGTSQWASIAYMMGKECNIPNPPYKLALTIQAVEHWKLKQKRVPVYDQTIARQAYAFLDYLKTGSMDFSPKQAEDFCFAFAFGIIEVDEAETRWPQLRNHESDRIAEMVNKLDSNTIDVNDHRVVQAIAMKAKVDNRSINVLYPNTVNKTWPQFWNFLKQSNRLAEEYK